MENEFPGRVHHERAEEIIEIFQIRLDDGFFDGVGDGDDWLGWLPHTCVAPSNTRTYNGYIAAPFQHGTPQDRIPTKDKKGAVLGWRAANPRLAIFIARPR